MRHLYRLLATLSLIVAGSAYGEDSPPVVPDIPKPLKVMPSKIKPVQTADDELSKAAADSPKLEDATNHGQLELLSPYPERGFPTDLAGEISRAQLNEFFANKSRTSLSAAARNLSLKLGLTAFPSISKDDKYPENLYGLRMNYLLSLGALEEAASLYKMNESAPPSPIAAQAGIEAMLGTNQIAVACLDQNTFHENVKTSHPEFWKNVASFCQALLGPSAGDTDELRLSNASRIYVEISNPVAAFVEDINKLDAVSTIALMKSSRLDKIFSVPDHLEKIDDKHLSIMVNFLTPAQSSLPLLAEGLRRGMVNDNLALNLLKSVDVTSPNAPHTEFLKEYFKVPESPMLSPRLLELSVNHPIREALLYPLYRAHEVAFPESNQKLSLKLLALTNQDLPLNLVRAAYPKTALNNENPESGEQFLIKSLMELSKSFDKNGKEINDPTLLGLNYLNYPQNDTKNAYDNILSLTHSGNYVMHNHDILSSLKESANKKRIIQVVIRSLAIIDDKPLEKLHPAELYQMLEALNSAGLTEETILLTREVLGNTIKN